jgi:hypothetical protein
VFASIRRYRLARGSVEDVARRVDEGFAEEIRAQPGFVCYEFIDCDDGEIITVSLFGNARQSEASRDLAQRWTGENLGDMELNRIEALHGEVMVSRAENEVLEPAHARMSGKFASVRSYRLRSGDVGELMHIVDDVFADQIRGMDGFEAYHALDCGRGEIMSISLFRDQVSAEESDERALQFVSGHLGAFDIERTEAIGGTVRVSRAMADVLQPAHA